MTDNFLPFLARDVASKHQPAGIVDDLVDVAVVAAVQRGKLLLIERVHIADQKAKPSTGTANEPLRSWYIQVRRTYSTGGIAKLIEDGCAVLKLEQGARGRSYIIAYPEIEIGERCVLKNPDVK